MHKIKAYILIETEYVSF